MPCGRARAATRTPWRSRARWRAARRARPPAERGAAPRDLGDRGRGRRPRASTPAATPARGPIATGCWPRRCVTRSRPGGRCGGRTARPRGARCAAPRRWPAPHDFTAFTPTETEHVRFERDVAQPSGGASACGALPGRAARALDRGRRLHAPHGQGAGRVRCSRSRAAGAALEDFEALLRERRGSAPARRRLRTASTSRRSGTELSPRRGQLRPRRRFGGAARQVHG